MQPAGVGVTHTHIYNYIYVYVLCIYIYGNYIYNIVFFKLKGCAYQVIAAVVRSAFLEAWQLQSTSWCVVAASLV